MSKSETHAQGVSPADEVKTAIAGFMSDIRQFHDDIETRLDQQKERLTMLDRKSHPQTTSMRPALAAAADHAAPHQKAFEAYLRSGDDDGLRGLVIEAKGMATNVAGDGGYLVDPETAATIQSVLRSNASLRAAASAWSSRGWCWGPRRLPCCTLPTCSRCRRGGSRPASNGSSQATARDNEVKVESSVDAADDTITATIAKKPKVPSVRTIVFCNPIRASASAGAASASSHLSISMGGRT